MPEKKNHVYDIQSVPRKLRNAFNLYRETKRNPVKKVQNECMRHSNCTPKRRETRVYQQKRYKMNAEMPYRVKADIQSVPGKPVKPQEKLHIHVPAAGKRYKMNEEKSKMIRRGTGNDLTAVKKVQNERRSSGLYRKRGAWHTICTPKVPMRGTI